MTAFHNRAPDEPDLRKRQHDALPAGVALDAVAQFSARLLRVRETKRLSRGCWHGAAGWAIHEVVHFR